MEIDESRAGPVAIVPIMFNVLFFSVYEEPRVGPSARFLSHLQVEGVTGTT